jgi:hypothetical protein
VTKLWKPQRKKSAKVSHKQNFYLAVLIPFIIALQVEWAKARARAERFGEEVDLLLEEMRRVRRYLAWRIEWWKARAFSGTSDVSEEVKAGHVAYALKQASVLQRLWTKFSMLWQSELSALGLEKDSIERDLVIT